MKRCIVCGEMVRDGCSHNCFGVRVNYHEAELQDTSNEGTGNVSLNIAMGHGHTRDFLGGDDD